MKHTPLVEKLIQSFTCLPGVGPRSAQRMAYALLERGRDDGRGLAAALNAAITARAANSACKGGGGGGEIFRLGLEPALLPAKTVCYVNYITKIERS